MGYQKPISTKTLQEITNRKLLKQIALEMGIEETPVFGDIVQAYEIFTGKSASGPIAGKIVGGRQESTPIGPVSRILQAATMLIPGATAVTKTLSKKIKNTDLYELQDTTAERTIHRHDWKEPQFRFNLEGTGDIYRELTKYNSDFFDPIYIQEKLKRVYRDFKGIDIKKLDSWEPGDPMPEGFSQINFFDARRKAFEKDKNRLLKLKSEYEALPVNTEAQQKAKDLTLSIIDGDFEKMKESWEWLNQFTQ